MVGAGISEEKKITVHLLCKQDFFFSFDTAFIHQQICYYVHFGENSSIAILSHWERQFCKCRNPIKLCSCFELWERIKGYRFLVCFGITIIMILNTLYSCVPKPQRDCKGSGITGVYPASA